MHALRLCIAAAALLAGVTCDEDERRHVCEEWADRAFDAEDRLKECKSRLGKSDAALGDQLYEYKNKVAQLTKQLGQGRQATVKRLQDEIADLKRRLREAKGGDYAKDDDDDDMYVPFGGKGKGKGNGKDGKNHHATTAAATDSTAGAECLDAAADMDPGPEDDVAATGGQCTDEQHGKLLNRIKELKRRLAEKSKQHPHASWFFGWVMESFKDYFTFARFMGRWFDALPGYFHEKVCCLVGAGFTLLLQGLKWVLSLFCGWRDRRRSREASDLARLQQREEYQRLPENVRYTLTRMVNAIDNADRDSLQRTYSEGWVPLFSGAVPLTGLAIALNVVVENIATSGEGLLGFIMSYVFGQTFSQLALGMGLVFSMSAVIVYLLCMTYSGLRGLNPPHEVRALLLRERFATITDLIAARNDAGVNRESATLLDLLDSNAARIMDGSAAVASQPAGKHEQQNADAAPTITPPEPSSSGNHFEPTEEIDLD